MGKQKRTVFLDEDQWIALEAISKETGASLSWQIRAAIEMWLEAKNKGKK